MTRFLAASLAVLALTAVSCGRANDPSTIVASGHVEATDVRVSTKTAGRLEAFTLQEGDRVERDEVLAHLDTTDGTLLLRQATAERDQAGADLRLRLAGARPEDIGELEAQVGQVTADLEGSARDLERMQGLLDRGSGTTKARDDAKTRQEMTAERLRATKQSLARLRAGSRAEEIDAARAHLRATEARVAQLEQQIQDATVRSPLRGLVTEKIAEAGELLQVGSGLCVITDLDDAWLTVYVPETDLGRLRLGQDAEVRTDAGEKREGKITFIASQAEFTPKNAQTRDERVKLVFKVKVGIGKNDGLFKPGMPGEAHIPVGPRT